MHIVYYDTPPEGLGDVRDLLHKCGWSEWQQADVVFHALRKSSHISIAVDTDCMNKCVGIARSMDDGAWSANIDCLLVHPSYQRKGIGSQLVSNLLKQINHIMYISVAPNDTSMLDFYKKLGFSHINNSVLLQAGTLID